MQNHWLFSSNNISFCKWKKADEKTKVNRMSKIWNFKNEIRLVAVRKQNVSCNRPLSIYLKFSLATRLRGHKQRKLNDHVYSFLLFVSSRPHYQADWFLYIESGLFEQTSYINGLNCSCFCHILNILLTELSWSVWENLELGVWRSRVQTSVFGLYLRPLSRYSHRDLLLG